MSTPLIPTRPLHPVNFAGTVFFLTWRERTGVDNLAGFLLNLISRSREGGSWEGHETRPSGLENTEGGNELEEGIDTAGFGGTIDE